MSAQQRGVELEQGQQWRELYGHLPSLVVEDVRKVALHLNQGDSSTKDELLAAGVMVGSHHIDTGIVSGVDNGFMRKIDELHKEGRLVAVASKRVGFGEAQDLAREQPEICPSTIFSRLDWGHRLAATGLRGVWTTRVSPLAFEPGPALPSGRDLSVNLVDGSRAAHAMVDFLVEAACLPEDVSARAYRMLLDRFMADRKAAVQDAQTSDNPVWRNR